jgi:hypothetical protein
MTVLVRAEGSETTIDPNPMYTSFLPSDLASIVVSDPSALTRTVIESVLKADVRCILSKGWSDRSFLPSDLACAMKFDSSVGGVQSVPSFKNQ